jgi:3-oxoacyl-[acyl-carrier-protein] synthase-3
MIGIKDVACYVPARTVENAEIAARFDFKPGFLRNKVGVEIRHVAASDESTSDMCVRAFDQLQQRYHGEDWGGVGLVLLCTQNPDYKLPHTSSILQARLSLPKAVLAFDVSLGCSGYVASLTTAKALMTELDLRQGLVFTCDPYTKVLDPHDKSTVPLFGDAASVTLLERGAPLGIGKGMFGNDGSMFETLIIRGSGTARRDGEAEQPLRMDGRNIFEMLKTQVPSNIRGCAQLNGLTLDDVELFLFHQASAWLLGVLREDLGLPAEKVPSNLNRVGNTVSTSIPLLLEEVLRSGRALPRTMLLSGFGVGLSWASVVLRA